MRDEEKLFNTLSEEDIDGKALLNTPTQPLLFKGDTMKVDSVQSFFQSIIANGALNDVISSIGGYPAVMKWYKPFTPFGVTYNNHFLYFCTYRYRYIFL